MMNMLPVISAFSLGKTATSAKLNASTGPLTPRMMVCVLAGFDFVVVVVALCASVCVCVCGCVHVCVCV